LKRKALLRGVADLLYNPITPDDAVVVLGGGIDIGPFIAAGQNVLRISFN
jgi:hypothetical protein